MDDETTCSLVVNLMETSLGLDHQTLHQSLGLIVLLVLEGHWEQCLFAYSTATCGLAERSHSVPSVRSYRSDRSRCFVRAVVALKFEVEEPASVASAAVQIVEDQFAMLIPH